MEEEIFKEPDTDEGFKKLISNFTAEKQGRLLALKNGSLSRDKFLDEVKDYIRVSMGIGGDGADRLLVRFEEYVFGYSRLSELIDDPDVSDIRVVRHDVIRVKKRGKRVNTDIAFADEKEYRQFVEYVAMKNQANISNLNAISRFTDADSHPDFILRFTVSMPLVNSNNSPYLCIRKVPKKFPLLSDLVEQEMLSMETAQMLVSRFRESSILICGGNSSGKTTLLNALKESLPDDVAVLVAQQADELTSRLHPDTMFMHSLPAGGENKVNYDLKNISIAGLTMDVDYFIIGEVKGAEALYLLNAACTGQVCAATIHSTSAQRATDKLVDYAMYESRYARNELMRMMDCFGTVVFMKDYKVNEVYSCTGWNEDRKEIEYERIL
ncbi:MAG: Flp pilus assembly complex ATPase component TadA [Lachnospiraceae bacterium]|nr:Flp pilus assembly complex ATPase component TadA [Lachnospiraceae bacterium]